MLVGVPQVGLATTAPVPTDLGGVALVEMAGIYINR
jgi:hypothetical protein